MKKRIVYADYAATGPVLPEALSEYDRASGELWGNPSSQHSMGRAARRALDAARTKTAELLDCSPRRVYFTSGGTEADNWAIKSCARFMKRTTGRKNVLVSQIEHPAVLNSAKSLVSEGFNIIYIPVTGEGVLDMTSAERLIDSDTAIVSVMYANNEIGTLQPIKELSSLAHKYGAYLMTDAVAAVGSLPVSFRECGSDMMTLSGHKFGAPRGVGALITSDTCDLPPFMDGGEQERGVRAGTENLPAIRALARALEVSVENLPDWERVGRLRDDIADHIIKKIGCAHINGSMTSRHPGNLSVSFDGVEGESLMLTLDSRGVCVSTGSACSSGAAEPSHVITALSDDKREALTRAKGSVRITLSHPTTKEDAEYIKECLTTCVASLRQITL